MLNYYIKYNVETQYIKNYTCEYFQTYLHLKNICNFNIPKVNWSKLKTKLYKHEEICNFENYIRKIINDKHVLQIILFGSVVKGKYEYNSDFDHWILYDFKVQMGSQKKEIIDNFKALCSKIDPFPYFIKDFHKLKYNKNLYINPALKNAWIIYDKTS